MNADERRSVFIRVHPRPNIGLFGLFERLLSFGQFLSQLLSERPDAPPATGRSLTLAVLCGRPRSSTSVSRIRVLFARSNGAKNCPFAALPDTSPIL
jgi:hypothetical protein